MKAEGTVEGVWWDDLGRLTRPESSIRQEVLNHAFVVRNPLHLRSIAVLDPACVPVKEEVPRFVNARQTPYSDVAGLPRTMIEFIAEQNGQFSSIELDRLFSGRFSRCRDLLRAPRLVLLLRP